jgi:SUF system FeS cluster assembly, SufBD
MKIPEPLCFQSTAFSDLLMLGVPPAPGFSADFHTLSRLFLDSSSHFGTTAEWTVDGSYGDDDVNILPHGTATLSIRVKPHCHAHIRISSSDALARLFLFLEHDSKVDLNISHVGTRFGLFSDVVIESDAQLTLSEQIDAAHTWRGSSFTLSPRALLTHQTRAVTRAGLHHFGGVLSLPEACSMASASQHLRVLRTSSSSQVLAKPWLRIHHSNVQATHGVAIGGHDAQALAYLQQRGLTLRDASSLLEHAFLS